MINRILILALSIVQMAVISSCTDEVELFDNNNYLSINLTKNSKKISEFSYTFKYDNASVTEKSIEIPVIIAGRGYNEDRLFEVKVIDSLTTAKPNVHYVIETEKNKIEANLTTGFIHIKTLKTSDMSQKSYILGLEIINNDNFLFGDNRTVVYTFSNKLEKPSWWYTDKNSNIGYYTEEKLSRWYEFWNIKDGSNPWSVFPYWDKPYSWSPWGYQKTVCAQSRELFKAWLTAHKDAPLMDENGDLIIHTLYLLNKQ